MTRQDSSFTHNYITCYHYSIKALTFHLVDLFYYMKQMAPDATQFKFLLDNYAMDHKVNSQKQVLSISFSILGISRWRNKWFLPVTDLYSHDYSYRCFCHHSGPSHQTGSSCSNFSGCTCKGKATWHDTALNMPSKTLISHKIKRLWGFEQIWGRTEGKVTGAHEVSGVYKISLILFDVSPGDDCCTSSVGIIIKQKDFLTFPVSDSARRGPLAKRLIPNPQGPPGSVVFIDLSLQRPQSGPLVVRSID